VEELKDEEDEGDAADADWELLLQPFEPVESVGELVEELEPPGSSLEELDEAPKREDPEMMLAVLRRLRGSEAAAQGASGGECCCCCWRR